MRVILDGVFNHTGSQSRYFNADGFYPDTGAAQSQTSPYFDWFSFHPWPTDYDAWWGIKTLPAVREDCPSYRNFIIHDENAVVRRWLRAGASGWRLDVADELPMDFLRKLRAAVKAENPDALVLGEVWEDASNKESYGVKRRYLLGHQLDSVMNYPFREAIISYIKGGNPNDFVLSVMTILENYPKPTIDVLMNFVSTHDIERAINRFGGENCDGKSKDWMAGRKLTEEQYAKGKNMLKSAFALMFFIAGVPSIYYGDEAGMQGYKDPFNRVCYMWGDEDNELIEFTRELGKIRKSSSAFKQGEMCFIYTDNDIMGFIRHGEDEDMLVFVNRSEYNRSIDSFLSLINDYSISVALRGLITDTGLNISAYDYAVVRCIK